MVEMALDAKAHHLRPSFPGLNSTGRGVLQTAPGEESDTQVLHVSRELDIALFPH